MARISRETPRLVILIVLAALVLVFIPITQARAAGGVVDPSIEQCFLDLHNAERASRGIHSLVRDEALTTYARDWSFEMEAKVFSHSDLSVPGDWRGIGENIGWSQGSGSGCTNLHNGFMNSDGHRANILRPAYDRVGIGVVYDTASNGIIWVTVVFGDSDGSTGPPATAISAVPAPPSGPSPCDGGLCDGLAAITLGGEWTVYDFVGDPAPVTFYFGNPGDMPFMGDWDGDGIDTPGLYRQSDGYVYLRNSNTQGDADLSFFFGDPGDIPLVGDWNGDGRDTVSVYRPSDATIYIVNTLGADGGGLGAADTSFVFGNPGDQPFVGDFDGDGVDTVGLYRRSTGFVYFRDSLTMGVADLSFFYGDPGDQILAGDWDGDGDDTVAVYRSSNNRLYVNLDNASGYADWDATVGAFASVVTGG